MKILVLAPHPDDEYGCAGTLARYAEEDGHTVHYWTFSGCGESLPAGYTVDDLYYESFRAVEVVSRHIPHVLRMEFPVRRLHEHRQDILEVMYEHRNEFDCVFCPSTVDKHQDHATITQEAIRAFKHTTILGYELPQNCVGFAGTAFFQLEQRHVEAKVRAMKMYHSQSGREYMKEQVIWGLAKLRGMQAGAEFAEAFEAIRVKF